MSAFSRGFYSIHKILGRHCNDQAACGGQAAPGRARARYIFELRPGALALGMGRTGGQNGWRGAYPVRRRICSRNLREELRGPLNQLLLRFFGYALICN